MAAEIDQNGIPRPCVRVKLRYDTSGARISYLI